MWLERGDAFYVDQSVSEDELTPVCSAVSGEVIQKSWVDVYLSVTVSDACAGCDESAG